MICKEPRSRSITTEKVFNRSKISDGHKKSFLHFSDEVEVLSSKEWSKGEKDKKMRTKRIKLAYELTRSS